MRTTCVHVPAAGGLFLLAVGQPPSEGRWCWCPFQMGFKSSPISCQLPTQISKTEDRSSRGGPPCLKFSSHMALRSIQVFCSVTFSPSTSASSSVYSIYFDFFGLSFIPSSSLTHLPAAPRHSAPPIVLSSSTTYTSGLFMGVSLHRFNSDLTLVCA